MIKTTQMLYEETRGYACPKDRISGLVKKGELFPIVKGLYETERDTPGNEQQEESAEWPSRAHPFPEFPYSPLLIS